MRIHTFFGCVRVDVRVWCDVVRCATSPHVRPRDVRNVMVALREFFGLSRSAHPHTHTQQWPPIHAGTEHHAPIGTSGAVKITASFFDAAACVTAVAANTTTTHDNGAILAKQCQME
jgi:hypothetical protein